MDHAVNWPTGLDDANMAAMHKMAACKKANHQILTQFFPSNMLMQPCKHTRQLLLGK